MRLDRAARALITWPFTADPPLTAADVWLNEEWRTATVADSEVVLLIAGPDAEDNPVGTTVLGLGRHVPRIRFSDDQEVLVEPAGLIDVE